MQNLTFKAPIRNQSNLNVVTIPAQYLTNDLLKLGNTYRFAVIEEVSDE